jgi:ABC-type proline/glycine betaine transport system permease subunit
MNSIPRLPLARWTDQAIDALQARWGPSTQAFSDQMENFIKGIQHLLNSIPPELFIIAVALLAWWLTGKKMALFSLVGLFFIYNVQLWAVTMETLAMVFTAVLSCGITMETLAMVFTAVLSCGIIGIPVGILSAKKQTAHNIIAPILDFMQTLPAFVYLLPAIPFFGLGVVPGVLTTIIFAMPPVIRLTDLGLRQVPQELIELGKSFGSTFMQMLFKIELPLARSTILAGINQCIMLSLSMVVIAAMIGAKGLGGVVWRAIQTLKFGMGFEAGLAIVVIAMILDRITQNLGKSK